ncbi:MAG: hypothetical protein ACRCWG_10515 [Sarcina sp.]
MTIIDSDLVPALLIQKLKRRDISLIDNKTNEVILIDNKLSDTIKSYYERQVKENGNKEVM